MQVSQQSDHITHAVIGGKQSIEFGISNSAEFFNILSSTLYKDQILAVVRETLCNAWDAHIEAGCTDRPVQVTLVDDMFTIKDFGKGIHHDDMGLIYGTYGNSTKKNDGKQTGGFGLGCKAPFAYTDHFEVVSCHEGIRTIYALAKSSAQAMGKPGITPIASFPCTDTGLTVGIRIKPADLRRFKELIACIAHNGDMNMTLNGEQLDTLDFDVSKGNFLVTRKFLLDVQHRIMVRYGNVIYPVEAAGNEDGFRSIVAHLNTLQGHGRHFSIVFQAPPHSIAVTPSRETLSMQDHTVNTLKGLFSGFLDSLTTDFEVACTKYTEEVTRKAVAAKRIDELLKREEHLPVLDKEADINVVADFNTMAQIYMQHNYPKGLAFRKEDVARRLETMAQNNLLDRGKVQSFLRELKGVQQECTRRSSWHVSAEATTWLQRRVLVPLLRKLGDAGLPTNQFYTCCSEDHTWQNHKRDNMPPLVLATKSAPHHLLTTLPYLRNIVVISTRRSELVDRAYQHPVFKEAGRYQGYLVYIAGRKKGELEEVRQFFANEGMRVVDLTLQDESEKEETYQVSTPRKPAKKGVTKLSSIRYSTGGISISNFLREDAERTETPEFILQVSLRDGDGHIKHWDMECSKHLVQLFGDKGGITNSTATFDKWRSKGVPTFTEYVQNKICSYILNNPRIEVYWANKCTHLDKSNRYSSLLKMISSNKILSKEFGLINPLTDEDKVYLALWAGLDRQYSPYVPNAELISVRTWLAGITTSVDSISLVSKMNSSLFSLLDSSEVRYAIANGSDQEITRLAAFLKFVLNS